ncbi:MAG: DUF4147 domain-containing protein [Balneolaceae bacterium]
MMSQKETLLSVITRSLEDVDPGSVVRKSVSYDPDREVLTIQGTELSIGRNQDIYVLGSGKASAAMGQALEQVLGDRIRDGIIITPKDTAGKGSRGRGTREEGRTASPEIIQLLEGSHPLPDRHSLASTYELIDLARHIPEGSFVFYMLSGGSSALLCMPAGDLEIGDIAETHSMLLKSGANIHEMNVVRTVVSAVKGGQLLKHLSKVVLADLIISDVPGDAFRSIGSGPTTPGNAEYGKASGILRKYGLWDRIPSAVRDHISTGISDGGSAGVHGHPGEHHQFLVSSARKLADSVAERCRRQGYQVDIITPAYDAAIAEVEASIIKKVQQAIVDRMDKASGLNAGGPGRCFIYYGESTVQVSGPGKGGRNQELALRIARHLTPGDSVTFASVGTDGVDGPTDAAGAVVDGHTMEQAKKLGLDPEDYLRNNDSYHFFEQTGDLIKTGPTGNNLMDLQVVLIGEQGNREPEQ